MSTTTIHKRKRHEAAARSARNATSEPAAPRPAAPGARRPMVVSREPIHEQILPYIRQDIIEGRWAPGERLPEPLLCKAFGISRTPLRDALKILEAEGFVELVPHVGAVVTDPSLPDVAEKMEILSALEQLAAEKVAQMRPPETLATIRDLHARMTEAAATRNAETYYRLNDDFHRAIVTGTGNKTLMDMHERIMWHVHRARHRANDYERLDEDAAEHHDLIVRHILGGGATGAAKAMREHLHTVTETILSQHMPDARDASTHTVAGTTANGTAREEDAQRMGKPRTRPRAAGSRPRGRRAAH